MPHFVIDCPKNIINIKSPEEVMQKVYDTAVSIDLLDKGDIKVRINPFEYYNTRNTKDDFIHIFANIMQGRTVSQIKNLSERIMRQLNLMFLNNKRLSLLIGAYVFLFSIFKEITFLYCSYEST